MTVLARRVAHSKLQAQESVPGAEVGAFLQILVGLWAKLATNVKNLIILAISVKVADKTIHNLVHTPNVIVATPNRDSRLSAGMIMSVQ